MRCCREGFTTGGIKNQDMAGRNSQLETSQGGIAIGGVAGTCGLLHETPEFQF